jgi:hypothetical protein
MVCVSRTPSLTFNQVTVRVHLANRQAHLYLLTLLGLYLLPKNRSGQLISLPILQTQGRTIHVT